MKIETLKDLKEFLGTLNETQLSQPAVLHIVEKTAQPIKSAHISDEDEYLTDEGYAPVSTHARLYESPIHEYEIRPAGFVYLFNEVSYE